MRRRCSACDYPSTVDRQPSTVAPRIALVLVVVLVLDQCRRDPSVAKRIADHFPESTNEMMKLE